MNPETWGLWILLDLTAEWIRRHLDWWPLRLGDAGVLPLLAITVYFATKSAVVRLMPWAARWLVRPLLLGVLEAIGWMLLVGQVALAWPFRVVSRRPSSLVYDIGDAVVAAVIFGRDRIRAAVLRFPERLAKWLSVFLLPAVAVAIWWWDHTYPYRCPASTFRPSEPWVTFAQWLGQML